MTLIRRVFREKRLAITIIVTALVSGIALHILVVYPLTVRADDTRQRRAMARQALLAAQQRYETARAAADDTTSATDELRRFYSDVLPGNLAGARGITYPRLAALARTHGLVLERRSSVPEEDENSSLARLRTTMLLAGDWPNIRRFIHALETASEFIVIEEVALGQGEELGASLVLTLGVSTYYQTDTET